MLWLIIIILILVIGVLSAYILLYKREIKTIVKRLQFIRENDTNKKINLQIKVKEINELAIQLKGKCDYEPKIVVLGHLQRGGSPSCADAVLASKLGSFAVESLIEGKNGVMVGSIDGNIVASPLSHAWEQRRSLNSEMLSLLDILSI